MQTIKITLAILSGIGAVTLIMFMFIWMEDREELKFPKDMERMNKELNKKYRKN